MIPNRRFPEGTLQLFEVIDGKRVLIEELPTSSKNRDKINQIRNHLLMVSPKKELVLSENNALR
jgi:hypothetical protein